MKKIARPRSFVQKMRLSLSLVLGLILVTGLVVAAVLFNQNQDNRQQASVEGCWCTPQNQCPAGWTWSNSNGYCSGSDQCCTQGGAPAIGGAAGGTQPGGTSDTTTTAIGTDWNCKGHTASAADQTIFNNTWNDGKARWLWEAAGNNADCGGNQSNPKTQASPVERGGGEGSSSRCDQDPQTAFACRDKDVGYDAGPCTCTRTSGTLCACVTPKADPAPADSGVGGTPICTTSDRSGCTCGIMRPLGTCPATESCTIGTCKPRATAAPPADSRVAVGQACTNRSQCLSGICNLKAQKCAECGMDSDCKGGKTCDVGRGICVNATPVVQAGPNEVAFCLDGAVKHAVNTTWCVEVAGTHIVASCKPRTATEGFIAKQVCGADQTCAKGKCVDSKPAETGGNTIAALLKVCKSGNQSYSVDTRWCGGTTAKPMAYICQVGGESAGSACNASEICRDGYCVATGQTSGPRNCRINGATEIASGQTYCDGQNIMVCQDSRPQIQQKCSATCAGLVGSAYCKDPTPVRNPGNTAPAIICPVGSTAQERSTDGVKKCICGDGAVVTPGQQCKPFCADDVAANCEKNDSTCKKTLDGGECKNADIAGRLCYALLTFRGTPSCVQKEVTSADCTGAYPLTFSECETALKSRTASGNTTQNECFNIVMNSAGQFSCVGEFSASACSADRTKTGCENAISGKQVCYDSNCRATRWIEQRDNCPDQEQAYPDYKSCMSSPTRKESPESTASPAACSAWREQTLRGVCSLLPGRVFDLASCGCVSRPTANPPMTDLPSTNPPPANPPPANPPPANPPPANPPPANPPTNGLPQNRSRHIDEDRSRGDESEAIDDRSDPSGDKNPIDGENQADAVADTQSRACILVLQSLESLDCSNPNNLRCKLLQQLATGFNCSQ